ncbi:hypothetical protein CF168_00730 [Shewanella bicestrii]|uniref:Uncharacterized protein n=1 Tax=Shewanella bicestrii TaxID=2018305 RepID=A0A220UHW1_9GAMM|nr:hypothetical protein CF168_00730 [Shewanella bicestrii]
MEVTVGGMDAAVEPIGIYLRRVTEMAGLNCRTINFHNQINQVVKLCSLPKTRLNTSLRKSPTQKKMPLQGVSGIKCIRMSMER